MVAGMVVSVRSKVKGTGRPHLRAQWRGPIGEFAIKLHCWAAGRILCCFKRFEGVP